MGVYIKDMEVPKRGSIEIQIYADGRVTVNPIYACKRIVGRAVPVPPHGRLVDADELKTAFPCGESVRTECVRATIENAPTVIEAEEGET